MKTRKIKAFFHRTTLPYGATPTPTRIRVKCPCLARVPEGGGGGWYIGVSIFSIQNKEILGVEKVLACLLAFYTCFKNVDSVGFKNEEACNHHGFIN